MAILSLAYAGWPSGTFLAVPPTEMGEKPGAERQRQVIFGQRNAPNEGCQHHILLLHINPPVWGRLQVHSDSSIATLQEFDWSDFHLYRFLIRGKAYGASRLRGCMFTTDARKVLSMNSRPCFSRKFTLKVLMAESSPNWGGQQYRLVREAGSLRERGHKVIVLCGETSDCEPIRHSIRGEI